MGTPASGPTLPDYTVLTMKDPNLVIITFLFRTSFANGFSLAETALKMSVT